ncbi:MAG: hypothetical protein HQL86_09780, partial [Magnetococcales bacterium]|nr:hypothetical protein [Magnetococcales bacterium]
MMRLVWPWLVGWFVVALSSQLLAWVMPIPFADKGWRDALTGVTFAAFLVAVPISTVLMRWAVEGAQSRVTVGARELAYVKYSMFLILLTIAFGALVFIFIKMAFPYFYVPVILIVILLVYLLARLCLSLVYAA